MAETTALPSVPTAKTVADELLYEVVNGQRRELPPMGAYENWIAGWLVQLLGPYVTTHRLGRVLPETLFLLDRSADLQRRPDVAFVSYGTWPQDRQVPNTSAWSIIPDLAVEVVSPTNTATEVVEKLADYFRAGVKLVWVIYPSHRQVYVYDSPITPRVQVIGQELDGGTVIPGFRLRLTTLFEVDPA